MGLANWPGMRPRAREKWPMIAATPPALRPVRSGGDGAPDTKAPKLVDGSISRMLTPAANILYMAHSTDVSMGDVRSCKRWHIGGRYTCHSTAENGVQYTLHGSQITHHKAMTCSHSQDGGVTSGGWSSQTAERTVALRRPLPAARCARQAAG